MINPLIQPGNYDITLNQNYLLEKLHVIDVRKAEMCLAWGNLFYYIVIGAIALGAFICIAQSFQEYVHAKQKAAREAEDAIQKAAIKAEHAIFDEFHELCRLIYEDQHVFKRPDKMIHEMYYPRMGEILKELRKKEAMLANKFRYLRPDYLYYKNLFAQLDEK